MDPQLIFGEILDFLTKTVSSPGAEGAVPGKPPWYLVEPQQAYEANWKPIAVADAAESRWREFLSVRASEVVPIETPTASSDSILSWEPPISPFYKLNVDVACSEDGKRGAGAIIRDGEGVIMVTACWSIPTNLTIAR
ncbi:hypothetical protein PIB30_050032 [Stylosanthes scabra]|uniref:RNase H type-1 domain-containing protein n=1 Tax=Stylosanthes scabra TaxID=79078 RepID=A0ABU6XF76_9FABA|nr:hypothetical protein [Stylosanthes scabra]